MKLFLSSMCELASHVTIVIIFYIILLPELSTRFRPLNSNEAYPENVPELRTSTLTRGRLAGCMATALPGRMRRWRAWRRQRRRTRLSNSRRRTRAKREEELVEKAQREWLAARKMMENEEDEPCLTEIHSVERSNKRLKVFETSTESERSATRTTLPRLKRRSKRGIPAVVSRAVYLPGQCALIKNLGNTSQQSRRAGAPAFTIQVWVKASGGQRSPSTFLELFNAPCSGTDSLAPGRLRKIWTLGLRSRSDWVTSCPSFYFKMHSDEPRLSVVVDSRKCYKPETWTHVAVTYDGQLVRFLINGVTVGISPAEWITELRGDDGMPQTCSHIVVGCRADGSRCYRGLLDNIRFYRSSKSQLSIKSQMYQQHIDSAATLQDTFDSATLDQWEETCGIVGGVHVVDDNSPSSASYRYPTVSTPPCGKTICDNPEIALRYATQWSLRQPKRVRYLLVNVSNDDGSNPMLFLPDVKRQHTHLNAIFERYNITWVAELRHVTNSSLRRKTIGCDPIKIGNRQCNRECMHERMGHDGGDCDVDVSPCAAVLKGNARCDPECNKRYHGWDGGDCCDPSVTDTDATCFDPSSPHRAYLSVTEYKGILKSDNSAKLSLIFANWTNPNSIGMATFPWDKEVFTNQGGTIVQLKPYDGASEMAGIIHELGHNLGLLHVHHGLRRDVNCENDCVELTPSMLKGDLCQDTNPTPMNTKCSDPDVGQNHCGFHQFNHTPYSNFMSYADGSCQDQFTSQQIGRMHCYLDLVYLNWREDEKTPVIPLPPKVVAASVYERSVTISWIPPLGFENRGGPLCDARCGSDGSLRQFASKATSPDGGADSHSSAEQATGPPDQEGCTMRGMNFWMALSSSGSMRGCEGRCFIEFTFETAVVPALLRLWITYGTEHTVDVRNIELRHDDDTHTSLGAHAAQCDVPLTLRVNTEKKVAGVKVYVQHTYTAIDAIEMVSTKQNEICSRCRKVRYEVVREPAFQLKGASVSTEDLHFTDMDLLDGVEYSYSVTPVDEGIIGQPTSSDTYYLGKTICGDGIVQCSDEECDDGNQEENDGCSSSCKLEHDYLCSGQPSECHVTNGFTRVSEPNSDVLCGSSPLAGYTDQWAVDVRPHTEAERFDGVDSAMSLEQLCSQLNATIAGAPDSMTSISGKFCDAIIDQRKVYRRSADAVTNLSMTYASSVLPSSVSLFVAAKTIAVEDIQVTLIDSVGRLHLVQSVPRKSPWCAGTVVKFMIDDALSRAAGLTNRIALSIQSDRVAVDAVSLRSFDATNRAFKILKQKANAFSGSINGDETAFDLAANASLHVSGETHINRSSIRLGLLEQIMITKSIEISKLYSSNHLTPLCAGGDCRVGVTADLRPATGCPHINRSIADVNCEETRALHGNGVVCNVTCLQGYQPTGTQKVHCSPGMMSTMQPCMPISCPPPSRPDAPLAVEITCPNGHSLGATCNVSCLTGDQSQITCTVLGVWAPAANLTCQAPCPRPPTMANASLMSSGCLASSRKTFRSGFSCRYRCRTGYSVAQRTSPSRRSFRMTCDSMGQWQGPGCQPVMCKSIEKVYDGHYNCTKLFFAGSVCDLNCDTQGVVQVTCGANGKWTGGLPVCPSMHNVCSHPQSPSDVRFRCDGFKIGKTCVATCGSSRHDIAVNGELLSRVGSTARGRIDPEAKQRTVVCSGGGRWFPDPSDLFCVDECSVDEIADGWCDPDNNRAHCNWDGGDCCASNTTSGKVEPFPSTCTVRCECKDPRSLEFRQRLSATRRRTQNFATVSARALARESHRRSRRLRRRLRKKANGDLSAKNSKATNRKSRRRRKHKSERKRRERKSARDRKTSGRRKNVN